MIVAFVYLFIVYVAQPNFPFGFIKSVFNLWKWVFSIIFNCGLIGCSAYI